MLTSLGRSFCYGVAAISISLISPSLTQSAAAQETQAATNVMQQANGSYLPTPPRIAGRIDGSNTVTLQNNVRKDLTPDRDMGVVEDQLPVRLLLVLKRTPSQQADLTSLLAHQQQPGAAEYHKWLTPEQYGNRFGASQQDVSELSTWLVSRGFQVNGVLNNKSMIDFTATAGGIRDNFHTSMHYWNIAGGRYPANAQDPQIPAALQALVSGISGLSKIPVRSHHTAPRPVSYDAATHRFYPVGTGSESTAQPKFANSNGNLDVTPQDFYTIYNVNPIFQTGNLGKGGTISLPEPTDMHYGTVDPSTGAATGGDVATFRSTFAVAGTLNMTVLHGAGSVTCSDPGINGAEGEATLDAEWANAVAPAAHLIFMSCDSSSVGDGFTSALTALIDNNISDVISSSYGNSEAVITSSDFSTDDMLANQAATQGQSFIDAAGDAGSADADQNTTTTAATGLNIDQYAVQPLITGVGGTDFQDKFDADRGGSPQSTYWGATNSASFGNALSYIPETVWNENCASSLIALDNASTTPAAYCGQGPSTGLVDGAVVGGGGGFSSHYGQPSYQAGTPGLTSSATKRAVPDIAFFASSGSVWGHALITCDSSSASTACTSNTTFEEAGGTSFTAPQFAGVIALLVTFTGERQGTLNPAIYALAKAQYAAAATKTACYADGQTSNTGVTTKLPASSCIFHDVTTSNNDVPCASGSLDCFTNPGSSYGLLSTTGSSSLTIGYPAGPQYDEATGFGSLNIANFINNFSSAFASTTQLTANPTSITPAQSTTLTGTVKGSVPTGYTTTPPALTGSVNFTSGATPIGSCILSGGSCSVSVAGSALATGPNSILATFVGSHTYPTSTSSIVTVTVSSPPPPTPATPTFSPAGGTYTTAQSVKLSDTTSGATIYYTTNGSTPGSGSTVYSTPISVTSTETIRAIAILNSVSSSVASATYTITGSASCQAINYSNGFTATGLSLNGGSTINGSALQLTDGSTFEARSAFYTTAAPVVSFTTDFTFLLTNAVADGITFTIQSNNPQSVGGYGIGLGYAGIGKSVALKFDLYNNNGEGANSTGVYVNGAQPTTPAISLTNYVNLHSGHVMHVHISYANATTTASITDTTTNGSWSGSINGDITQAVGKNAYIGFTGGTGTYTAIQKILTWSFNGCPQ